MFSTIVTCATNCRENDFNTLIVLAKNPIFRSFLPANLMLEVNSVCNIVIFPIFWKNTIEYPEFSVYSACKNAPLYVLNQKSRIFGVFDELSVK